jgi:glycosyltransferase involved in cell wall biosynthesis
MSKTLAVAIPAYNEEQTICEVVASVPKTIPGIDKIVTIVVNDGSRDQTSSQATICATHVINHAINLGAGAATISAFEAVKKIKADICITIDGDAQHDPKDIAKLIKPIVEGRADVVLGTRMLNTEGMPKFKILGNWIMNVVTFLVFHRWTTDSQSGMRAISLKALKRMKFNSTGYEICSELIGEVQRNQLKMIELPIRTIYTDYSKMKGQDFLNAINIFTRILFIRLGNLK